jgi:hypothetical protein
MLRISYNYLKDKDGLLTRNGVPFTGLAYEGDDRVERILEVQEGRLVGVSNDWIGSPPRLKRKESEDEIYELPEYRDTDFSVTDYVFDDRTGSLLEESVYRNGRSKEHRFWYCSGLPSAIAGYRQDCLWETNHWFENRQVESYQLFNSDRSDILFGVSYDKSGRLRDWEPPALGLSVDYQIEGSVASSDLILSGEVIDRDVLNKMSLEHVEYLTLYNTGITLKDVLECFQELIMLKVYKPSIFSESDVREYKRRFDLSTVIYNGKSIGGIGSALRGEH